MSLPFPAARRVDLPGGDWIALHDSGSGPTLLLLHGFTDRAESFALIAPHLAGCRLVMPDLRGHGASCRGDLTGLEDFACDIEEMARAINLTEALVVGHSMGALMALHLAARGRLAVRGLVLVSGSLQPASPALARIAEGFAALPAPLPADHPFLDDWYACSRPVPAAFLAPLRAGCRAMRPGDWASCLSFLGTADLRDLARSLDLPALIVSGDRDPIFPPAHGLALQHHLGGAQSLFLRNVGHNPHWEAPQEVAGAILAFIRHLDPVT